MPNGWIKMQIHSLTVGGAYGNAETIVFTVEHVAFQSILHLMLCTNVSCLLMRTWKCSSCPVSALFFPIIYNNNKYLWTLLNQSWAIPYTLLLKCLSMQPSAVLLLLFRLSLVSFSTVKQWPGPVLPPWGTTDYCKTNSMCMCDLHVQKSCGACTVCTSYSDDIICIKHTVRCPSRMCKNWSILWALLYTKQFCVTFHCGHLLVTKM